MGAFAQCLHRFKSDDEGAIAVIFGLVAVVFVAFGGLSVDMARTYGASSRAGAALDSAILAAGEARIRRGLSDSEVTELAEKYFRANISGAGNRQNEYSNFSLTISNNGQTFNASVDVSVPMHFAGLVSLNKIDFTSSASATFDQQDLELGLMLDVTGSMDWSVPGGTGSKLVALKRAVTRDLLGTLYPNGDNPKIKVGFAPYSAAVNTGSFASQVRDQGAPSSDNCVVERELQRDTDAAPGTGRFFRSVEEANNSLTQDRNNNNRYDFYECPNAEVLPLTSSKSQLVNTINGYDADGRTAGHLGIAWAWYLISPEWANIWGGNSAPKPYNAPNLIKAVVLLTDGEFNAAYDGSDFDNPAKRESVERAERLCENIKNENVVVYTIGFALNDPTAIRTLEDCASSDSVSGRKLFYPSANENDLRDAFQEIASSLTNLRLSQ